MTAQPTPAGRAGSAGAAGRVLRNLRHGGQVLPDDAPGAKRTADTLESVSLASAVSYGLDLEVAEVSTPFGYLFDGLTADPAAHLPAEDPAAVVRALKALGAAMVEQEPPAGDTFGADGNSTIPAVYTYWGQFVDHDITAGTDRLNEVGHVTQPDLHPEPPERVAATVRNLRLPALNLDSVYGDGPTLPGEPETEAAAMYDGILLRLGTVTEVSKNPGFPILGQHIPLEADAARDLPRTADRQPLIGDGRNDENLVVAQLHVAFLRFHNAAVSWVRRTEPGLADDRAVFERARQLVRWHYQWLVVHDYLPTVALPGVVDQVLADGGTLYDRRDGEVYMPLEFSVAAYRFGHSMVRGVYDYNRNFGRPGRNQPAAPFFLLFAFTGRGGFFGQGDTLPFNWVVEWDRFVEKAPRSPDHFARKIDTRIAPPLFEMANEVQGLPTSTPQEIDVAAILRQLAVRNLLRGYQLSLPTGQAVATALGLVPLSPAELQLDTSDAVGTALRDGGFLGRTPLWYYVLKEAEVRADGNSLGELGSRIVAETLVGQVRMDPESYLAQECPWTPEQGIRLPDGRPIRTVKDLLRVAGVLPTRP